MAKKQYKFFISTFLLCVVGLLFSVWNLLDKEAFICITEGCNLFSEYSINGISLWWLGILGFSILLIFALFGAGLAGWLTAGVGLVLDIFLLFIMIFTMPCFNCLIIGLLLAITYLSFREKASKKWITSKRSILFGVWLVFFIVNAGGIVSEVQKPWAIMESKSGTASIHAYFSPSCSACRDLISAQSEQDDISWYPVSENKDDIWRIAMIKEKLEFGESLNIAVLAASSAETSEWNAFSPSSLMLQFRLWRNAAHVYASGSKVLPFVEYHGVPASLLHQNFPEPVPPTPTSLEPSSPSTSPIDLMGIAGSCGETMDPC